MAYGVAVGIGLVIGTVVGFYLAALAIAYWSKSKPDDFMSFFQTINRR